MRLGVNVDHVATVRQARRTFEPSPVFAALIAQQAGADQITLHLREDRRHIQDRDLELIKELITIPVNLEMAPTEEMREIALRVKPDRITLVPERREEITTEGGLDVVSLKEKLKEYLKPIKEAGIEVSLFIEAQKEQIDASVEVGADAIEIHTGRYANLWNEHRFEEAKEELNRIKEAAIYAKEKGLKVYAGHGLTYHNVKDFVRELKGYVEELNIGHSIVANAVIFGFERAVKEMLNLIKT
ncbi:pyridoxine 5'-phosphate synthase [Aquifex aeolicus]|uniref:Pyridoxine 5'-phosphate synthase n=1 Tax=Aquifex aeolicus (strain VF5) TaxID=224324 RepID=PDXJ_AQUAE|nr:pyridoxine 5'-phosphate synthase [Aquifex aeolicus]O67417.1 RecName: Full=Pyridoxine 5'-phosphate synthase; Short=PNP synthase [Aquifex aeolicus VF5]AAC07372.1 pyridoxal phosphate synthetase [Aquifex aeolicus VF5]